VKEGLVLKSTGSWYIVKCEGKLFNCVLKGKFRMDGLKTSNPIAVGDNVKFILEDDETGVIKKVVQRENYLIRKLTKKGGIYHIVASNLDLAALVITTFEPRTSKGFIDRFLTSVEAFHIPVLLIFNKMDMIDTETDEVLNDYIDLYESIGYKCIQTSAETGEGVKHLEDVIKGKKTLFTGHSGVGKSSLLNRILPESQQKVTETSESTGKGLHTTTFAQMFELPDGETYIIDTPGLRELGIIEMEEYELSHFFIELKKYISSCKFNTCLHKTEPGCAVIEAVENGRIAESRYMSYISLLEGSNNRG
jgi:ribosome biogenesis GTPase